MKICDQRRFISISLIVLIVGHTIVLPCLAAPLPKDTDGREIFTLEGINKEAVERVSPPLPLPDGKSADIYGGDIPQGHVSNETVPFQEVTYDVPMEYNDQVLSFIEFFQTRMKNRLEEWLARSGRYLPLMREILREQQVPEDMVFLVLIESGFNPKAFSKAKAAGQWQFIQGTGRQYGLRIDQWVDERRDPVKSTVAAAKYLKDLYGMFGSWPLSAASYNAGEGKIMRALARTNGENFWHLNDSTYVRPETKNYVPKFMAATIIAKNPQKYGFFVDYQDPLRYDEAEVGRLTSLHAVAKATRVTLEEIKELNPELKKATTPPYAHSYLVKLPYGKKEMFLANFYPEKSKANHTKGSRVHRIGKGETIYSISRKYDVGVEQLLSVNKLGNNAKIRAGHMLIIPSEEIRKRI